MKRISVILFVLALMGTASAQSTSFGLTSATTLAGCTSNATYTLCLYGTAAAPGVAVSVSGGLFQSVQATPVPGPQGPAGPAGAIGPQGPQGVPGPVQSFASANCTSYTLTSAGALLNNCTEK